MEHTGGMAHPARGGEHGVCTNRVRPGRRTGATVTGGVCTARESPFHASTGLAGYDRTASRRPDEPQERLRIHRIGNDSAMSNQRIGIAIDKTGWWSKYEELAKAMDLDHEVFEIERSDWLERTKRFACVLWRPNLDPPYCDEAREKIYFIEQFLQKRVFPNWSTFWHYDNKRAQAYL